MEQVRVRAQAWEPQRPEQVREQVREQVLAQVREQVLARGQVQQVQVRN